MKTVALFKRAVAAAAVAFVLVACSKEESEVPAPQTVRPVPYTFLIGDASSTRMLLGSGEHGRFGLWESSDRIGTLLTASGSTTSAFANVTPGSPVSFRIYNNGGFAGGEQVRAYYPYNSATTGLDAVKLSIPPSQNQGSAGFDFSAMPMVSSVYEIPGPIADNFNPVGELYFANLAAVAEFRIFSSNGAYASETVSSVIFEGSAPLAGSFTADISQMDVFDPSTLAISGYSENTVCTAVDPQVQVGSSSSGATSVYMVLAPGSYSGRVTVVTDKATYTYTLSKPQEFKRSVVRSLGVDLGTCADRKSTGSYNSITVTKTISQIFSYMGVTPENSKVYDVLAMDDVVTLEADYGKYYSTGTSWRIYPPMAAAPGNGNLKVKVKNGYELQSVTFTYSVNAGTSGGQSVTPTFSGPASNTPLALSGSVGIFFVSGKAGHLRITKVSVTYVQTGAAAQRLYLDCPEIPVVSTTCCISGEEHFEDTEGLSHWFEFDTPDANKKIITHTFLNGGRRYRNYTAMIDKEKRCPLWVAYPMHGVTYRDYSLGRGDFSDKTSYDPAIPSSWQSNGTSINYNSGNGYAKGHMCASKDRQVTYASNDETFYYTNQVPQWQNGFNSGVWSSLEGDVQTKAASLTSADTLYVVSGALFDPATIADSKDGGDLAHPSHMYKLLMLCSFDASGNVTDAKGAAYLYENKTHTGKKYYNAEYLTTIDAIEQRTGFDFFASVPASLQNAAESAFTSIL